MGITEIPCNTTVAKKFPCYDYNLPKVRGSAPQTDTEFYQAGFGAPLPPWPAALNKN
jgi:hypothetical protein